jgi:hypothetical protein
MRVRTNTYTHTQPCEANVSAASMPTKISVFDAPIPKNINPDIQKKKMLAVQIETFCTKTTFHNRKISKACPAFSTSHTMSTRALKMKNTAFQNAFEARGYPRIPKTNST